MDPSMSSLLKWSIENTPASSNRATLPNGDGNSNNTTTATPTPPSRPLDTTALSALFGGPSDADLMRAAVACISDPTTTLANKLIAFDNLEQLIEAIDNANNLGPLGLWTPLLATLTAPEPELQRMGAWCIGTAVQNNPTAQEKALGGGAVGLLLGLAMGTGSEEKDGDAAVRRKACYALSSLMRNFQPGVEHVLEQLPEALRIEEKVDAGDMEQVDRVMDRIRGA